jgi:hypothetical protein
MNTKIKTVENLQEWITSHSNFIIIENDTDRFIVQCPCDATVTIELTETDDFLKIILNTIACFEDFSADEKFDEWWNPAFGKHNGFTPSEFLRMLMADEKALRELAEELRELVK